MQVPDNLQFFLLVVRQHSGPTVTTINEYQHFIWPMCRFICEDNFPAWQLIRIISHLMWY